MKNVFIIGSKGIPAQYGGFETFVDQLTENRMSSEIQYHVACMGNDRKEFYYHDARCFKIPVPNIGPGKAIIYDVKALKACIEYIKKNEIENAIVYILTCRIGPFIGAYRKMLNALGGKIWVNPDGNEWKRKKWNWLVRKYWKWSEHLMVKNAEFLICDSKNIEKYIKREYARYTPDTIFIPYGADLTVEISKSDEDVWLKWSEKYKITAQNYYLIVGRFVPENNYITMIKEFHQSHTNKKLIIVTNLDNKKLYKQIMELEGIKEDKRICFVGTVYNKKLLYQVRKNAFAYIHGHEVGGTNPSLLEALATTRINLLLDVCYNREVAEKGAIYWSKQEGSLRKLIENVEKIKLEKAVQLEKNAKERISTVYNWMNIAETYEQLIMKKS